MAHAVMVAGAGKIGALISALLLESNDYQVHLIDKQFNGADCVRLSKRFPQLVMSTIDVMDKDKIQSYAKQHNIEAILSCLPYFCNVAVAESAAHAGLHYFDLTEDTAVTAKVRQLASDAQTAFVPQCGLAPGYIGIVANHYMKAFDEVDTVKMRVGALPANASNALHYTLTWSTDGVINEYGNPCDAIESGESVLLPPLEGLETIELDGLRYEAFNTSGGLGSLPELYHGKVRNMNYKTVRYPGHCEKMHFLMNDLRMNEDRETLKRILENAVPKTYQDLVLIYVSVTGQQQGQFLGQHYVKKVYPKIIADINWSAIQITTASGICAVVDHVLANSDRYRGFVYQEQLSLDEVLANRFGQNYQ